MGKKRTIVVTVYGHGKTIDNITVNSFHGYKKNIYYEKILDDAGAYCNTVNSLELKGDSWVRAKIVAENAQYSLDSFLPLNFSDTIMKLDNLSIQKVLRNVDFTDLAKSLKDQNETVREKIFSNMSKRATKIVKEDMEVMKAVMINEIKNHQEFILSIIQYLEETGEIIIPNYKGETVK